VPVKKSQPRPRRQISPATVIAAIEGGRVDKQGRHYFSTAAILVGLGQVPRFGTPSDAARGRLQAVLNRLVKAGLAVRGRKDTYHLTLPAAAAPPAARP
jgi:hypothetical protein